MNIIINSPKLFYKKLTTLFVVTIILVPLIHYKFYVPALMYIGALLLLHIYILYIYFKGVDWREFMGSKKEFIARLSGIAFFMYLLTVLSFTGTTAAILLNLAGAFTLHVVILVFMMASRTAPETV